MATLGGARCLGREAELGSLETGKLADLAVWRVDHLAGAGIADPVVTLVFGAPVLEHVYVGGRPIVRSGVLVTADAAALAVAAARASAAIAPASAAQRIGKTLVVRLGANQYGKAEVRLVRVARGAGPAAAT